MKSYTSTTYQSAKFQNSTGPRQGLIGQDGASSGFVLEHVEALELKPRLSWQTNDSGVWLHVWQNGIEVLLVGKCRYTEYNEVSSRYCFACILGDEGGLGLDLHRIEGNNHIFLTILTAILTPKDSAQTRLKQQHKCQRDIRARAQRERKRQRKNAR